MDSAKNRRWPSAENGTLLLPLGSEFDNPRLGRVAKQERRMNGLIYLIGLIVVILAILSFFGLR